MPRNRSTWTFICECSQIAQGHLVHEKVPPQGAVTAGHVVAPNRRRGQVRGGWGEGGGGCRTWRWRTIADAGPNPYRVPCSALLLGRSPLVKTFCHALLHTHTIDEVEPLVARYLEAAKAQSNKQGRLRYWHLHSLYTSARLHEVLCTCTPCWEPPHAARPLHSTKADSVSHRY